MGARRVHRRTVCCLPSWHAMPSHRWLPLLSHGLRSLVRVVSLASRATLLCAPDSLSVDGCHSASHFPLQLPVCSLSWRLHLSTSHLVSLFLPISWAHHLAIVELTLDRSLYWRHTFPFLEPLIFSPFHPALSWPSPSWPSPGLSPTHHHTFKPAQSLSKFRFFSSTVNIVCRGKLVETFTIVLYRFTEKMHF